mmetsp:Transcript_37946/g.80676  ORF Transcript_37946/g.80676 Transcript_37946/m.80676 type:complete len:180 (-) Transcript_37946:17-556(-)
MQSLFVVALVLLHAITCASVRSSQTGPLLELTGVHQATGTPSCVVIHGGALLKELVKMKTEWLHALAQAESDVMFYTSNAGAANWGQDLWESSATKAATTFPAFEATFNPVRVATFNEKCIGSRVVGCCKISSRAVGAACDDQVTEAECLARGNVDWASWRFEGNGKKCEHRNLDVDCV